MPLILCRGPVSDKTYKDLTAAFCTAADSVYKQGSRVSRYNIKLVSAVNLTRSATVD
jgi:hypothetical protein